MNKQQLRDEAVKARDAIVDQAYEAYSAIIDPAGKAFSAIVDPAYKAYEARIKEIDAMPDEIPDTIEQNGKVYKLVN